MQKKKLHTFYLLPTRTHNTIFFGIVMAYKTAIVIAFIVTLKLFQLKTLKMYAALLCFEVRDNKNMKRKNLLQNSRLKAGNGHKLCMCEKETEM